MRSPATLRSLTCQPGSANDPIDTASESFSVGHSRLGARAVGDREHLDLLGSGVRIVGGFGRVPRHELGADASEPDANLGGDRHRRARRLAQVAVQVGRDDRTHLFERRDPLHRHHCGVARLADFGLAQRVDRALELIEKRSRVEVAKHRPGLAARPAHQPALCS